MMVSSPPPPSSVFVPASPVIESACGEPITPSTPDSVSPPSPLAVPAVRSTVTGAVEPSKLAVSRPAPPSSVSEPGPPSRTSSPPPPSSVSLPPSPQSTSSPPVPVSVSLPDVPVIVQTDGAAWPALPPPIASAAAIPTAAIAMRVRRVRPIRSLYGTARATPARI